MSDNDQKKQRIIRSKPSTEYFSLPNGVAQNIDLPYDALGVLVYLLSKPSEWETTVFDLRKRGDGKSKIYRILKDLERIGYMKRPSKYQDKSTGKWNWTPRIVADIPVYTLPCPSKPDTGEPDTDNKEIKEVKTDKKEQIIKKDIAASVKPSQAPAQAISAESDLITLNAHYYQGVQYAGYHCPMCDNVLSCDVWFIPVLEKAICENCFGRLEDAETTGRGSTVTWTDSIHDDTLQDYIDDEQEQHMTEYEYGNISASGKVPTQMAVDGIVYHAERNGQDKIMQLMAECKCKVYDDTRPMVHTLYSTSPGASDNIMVCHACGDIKYGREHSKGKDAPTLTDEQAAVLELMRNWLFGDKPIPRSVRGKYQHMGYCDWQGNLNAVGYAALEAHKAAKSPTMTEVDAAIYGTRDKPVNPDAHIIALTAPELDEPKPIDDKKQVAKNMWEAVKHTWGLNDNAAWKIAKLQQFFTGAIKKTGKYKSMFQYQLDEIPANALEVVAFGRWYRSEYEDATLPENGEKLRSHFEAFRGSGERYGKFMRQGESVILRKLPGIIMAGINDEPPAPVEPEVAEEDMIQVSPEDMQKMYDSIGRGGAK